MLSTVLDSDLQRIFLSLSIEEKKRLAGKTVFITGFAGSLGYMLMHFFASYGPQLTLKKVYCLDNFMFGKPAWVSRFDADPLFVIREGDVTVHGFDFAQDADLIFHMASLASPVYYRLHPIETIDADVTGLRRLLDFYADKKICNLLFYSTSEVYGDPEPAMVPTPETYWGNVNTSGPRACYDESKRFAETLCYYYHHQLNFPVTVVRPFNSFGPGLRTNDQRVVADFAQAVLTNNDITIFSDGKTTRTFCYVADTTIGCLKCIFHDKYDIFNIGLDGEEITIHRLAEIYQDIGKKYFGYTGKITYKTHTDRHYLTDNPRRRCPDIAKAREILDYNPETDTETAVLRYLTHLLETREV
ncbi:MAG: NAD-dependent epimerase/dehydratase family protein [Spirochaetales bacterium]|nr:NAD-dependent epimerase/dehydratase family protein [Spirochaetales bacterium]